jgi:hypothetical protein
MDSLCFAGMKRFLRVGHAVVVVSNIGWAVVPPRHDVSDRPRISDSQRASHTGKLPSSMTIFKPDSLLSLSLEAGGGRRLLAPHTIGSMLKAWLLANSTS